VTEIWPFKSDVFTGEYFLSFAMTDRPRQDNKEQSIILEV
jgi:hypothetical protein